MTGWVGWGSCFLVCWEVFYIFSAIVTRRALLYDKRWRKSSEKIRYFAICNILGTYFTIYLYIKMSELLHDKSNKMTCSLSEYSEPDPRHRCRHEETFGPYSYPLSAQRRLWSDWMDAQSDLRFRWVHRSFCLFCHASAQTVLMNTAIFSFSNTDKLCPIILNYALLKHLTCEDLFTVAHYLW